MRRGHDSCDPRHLRDLKRVSHPIRVRLPVNKDLNSSQQEVNAASGFILPISSRLILKLIFYVFLQFQLLTLINLVLVEVYRMYRNQVHYCETLVFLISH